MFDRYGRVRCEACVTGVMRTIDAHRGEALLRCPDCSNTLVVRWPKKYDYLSKDEGDQIAA